MARPKKQESEYKEDKLEQVEVQVAKLWINDQGDTAVKGQKVYMTKENAEVCRKRGQVK